jgi:hypothetical protein
VGRKPKRLGTNSESDFSEPTTPNIGASVQDEAIHDLASIMAYFAKGLRPSTSVPLAVELLVPFLEQGMTVDDAEALGRTLRDLKHEDGHLQ